MKMCENQNGVGPLSVRPSSSRSRPAGNPTTAVSGTAIDVVFFRMFCKRFGPDATAGALPPPPMLLFLGCCCGMLLLLAPGTSACRSMGVSERDAGDPILSHRGTDPPEPVRAAGPEGTRPDAGNGGQEDDDDRRSHEEGELKVGERWEFPVAQTKRGNIWGTVEQSRAGKRVLAFRGIRYARPPTGDRRFRPPEPAPAPPSGSMTEAKHDGHLCPQHLQFKPDIWVGQEDCLWLNVFTRDLVLRNRRPVLVWIHGGGFTRGSAAEYDPDYLLDRDDLVLVTVNYRLGLFGFLSTEDSEAPGNYGMLDQVMALQWVKANVEAFSGDPTRITIAGQQAGGASVHYHLLSPLSRGLFARAVSMSGSALCWWASVKRPLEKAKKLARLLKCPHKVAHDGTPMYGNGTDSTRGLVDCLRSKDTESLMNAHPNFFEWQHLSQTQEPMTAWSPRVDGEASPMPFMPAEPVDLMTTGNFQYVPWMVGLTDDEGAGKAAALIQHPKAFEEFNEKFAELGPLTFGFHDGQTEAPKIHAKSVKDRYWGASLTVPAIKKYADAVSDSAYAFPIDTAAKIHAMKSRESVFMYHFSYRGSHSFVHMAIDTHPPKRQDPPQADELHPEGEQPPDRSFGAANGDDLIYLFPILNGAFRPLPPEDLVFSERLIQLLASFVADGKPAIVMRSPPPPASSEDDVDDFGKAAGDPDGGGANITFAWEPVLAHNARHLNIGNQMGMDDGMPNHERLNFWNQLPVFWNCDRSAYKPAPPIVLKEEL